jgi:hypothetical protein
MPSKHTRRAALRFGVGLLAASALGGCLSAASISAGPDCVTTATEHGDGDVIQEASVHVDDEEAILRIHLVDGAADAAGVDRIEVVQLRDELLYQIPVLGDRRSYEVTIGRRPIHGAYSIRAVSEDSLAVVDRMNIEFNCFAEE